jgi:hypothetical protein
MSQWDERNGPLPGNRDDLQVIFVVLLFALAIIAAFVLMAIYLPHGTTTGPIVHGG